MLISSGKMDKRITVQQLVLTQDQYGATSQNWVDVASMWAHVWDTSTSHAFISDKQTSAVTTKVRIRWRDDIKPYMRVVFRNEFYEITGVLDPSGRREYLELMTQVGLSDG